MKVAVVGSGAVGGFYGSLLARAGHDVTFVARGRHLAAIREHGLRVRGPYADFVTRAPATDETLSVGPVDLV
ncbi:MAG TPA: 2-dehydropantoate 2-reductase N-terminal domain-containing protein, partial [Vicinamibacterales bacterium]